MTPFSPEKPPENSNKENAPQTEDENQEEQGPTLEKPQNGSDKTGHKLEPVPDETKKKVKQALEKPGSDQEQSNSDS